jgi:hypothetical protein
LVYVRYGEYEKVLAMPQTPSLDPRLSFGRSIHYYARSLSSAALGQASPAARYLELLASAVHGVPRDSKPTSHAFYPYHREMAEVMLHLAESAVHVMHIRSTTTTTSSSSRYHNTHNVQSTQLSHNEHANSDDNTPVSDRLQAAIKGLRSAMALQDSFSYMEPENFYLPVRQCLAAVHLFACQYGISSNGNDVCNVSIAMALYREDLEVHPKNDWAELGLQRAADYMTDTKTTKRQRKMGSVSMNDDVKLAMRRRTLTGQRTYIGSCCELGLCLS